MQRSSSQLVSPLTIATTLASVMRSASVDLALVVAVLWQYIAALEATVFLGRKTLAVCQPSGYDGLGSTGIPNVAVFDVQLRALVSSDSHSMTGIPNNLVQACTLTGSVEGLSMFKLP